jgi:hypothetical protein
MSAHRIFASHRDAADGLDRPVMFDLCGEDLQVERAIEAKRRRGSSY